MRATSIPKTQFATAVSWASLLLAVACLAFLAWYIPFDRRAYVAMFRDFHMQLPGVTMLMLSIPDVAFPLFAASLALIACVLQWRMRTNAGAALGHMLIVVLCCVAFVAYRESLFQPLSQLLRAISSGPRGG